MKKLIGLLFVFAVIMCFAPTVFAAENLYAASVDGEVSMYISPNETSYEITKIPACSKMRLLKTERTWGLVSFNRKCGWINMSYTRTSYKKAANATGRDSEKKVVVKTEDKSAILYDVPSEEELLGSDIKHDVVNDTVLEIKRETQSGWGLVSMNGKLSWIRMEHTAPFSDPYKSGEFDTKYVYVLSKTGKGVEMWDSPEKKNVRLVIPDCTKLTVRAEDEESGYVYVAHRGVNGWIDFSCTTESLANAQNSAGNALNAEYVVSPKDSDVAPLLSIPSEDMEDGGKKLADIEKGTYVFVQRSSVVGWCLINYKGEMGWISSQNLVKAEESENEIVSLLETQEERYVATEDCEGLQLYGSYNDENEASVIPECVKVMVIAQKGDYEYVVSDYASGWAKKGNTKESYDKAVNAYKLENDLSYKAEKELRVMSLPTYSEKCSSVELAIIEKGTDFSIMKEVETSDSDWGYTEINGVAGWVNLKSTQRTEITAFDIILVVLAAVGIIAAAFAVIFILRRKEKRKKLEKEVVENENISDGDSIAEKEPADVSGE